MGKLWSRCLSSLARSAPQNSSITNLKIAFRKLFDFEPGSQKKLVKIDKVGAIKTLKKVYSTAVAAKGAVFTSKCKNAYIMSLLSLKLEELVIHGWNKIAVILSFTVTWLEMPPVFLLSLLTARGRLHPGNGLACSASYMYSLCVLPQVLLPLHFSLSIRKQD